MLENVGQATWKDSLRCLARGGRLVTYGATTGQSGDTNLALLFWKQIVIMGTTMAAIMAKSIRMPGSIPTMLSFGWM